MHIPLQETFIPHFHGEGTYDEYPVIVLSDIRGKNLSDLITRPEADDTMLAGELEGALKQFHSYGISYGEAVLSNVFKLESE